MLSKRLQTIANMVPENGTIFDVGSDHGKLIIYLAENGIIRFGYGGENKEGPYKILSSHLKSSKRSDILKPIFQDGILTVPDDVNVLSICGMGGYLINEILLAHKENLKNVTDIIIDAHNATKEVREVIISLGYKIVEEKIILEKSVYYEIMHFQKGNAKYSSEELEFGPYLVKEKDSIFLSKWNRIVERYENVINSIHDENRINELRADIERIKKVL